RGRAAAPGRSRRPLSGLPRAGRPTRGADRDCRLVAIPPGMASAGVSRRPAGPSAVGAAPALGVAVRRARGAFGGPTARLAVALRGGGGKHALSLRSGLEVSCDLRRAGALPGAARAPRLGPGRPHRRRGSGAWL